MDDMQKASSQGTGEKVIIPLFVVLAHMIQKEMARLSYRLFHFILISFTLILETKIIPKTGAEKLVMSHVEPRVK